MRHLVLIIITILSLNGYCKTPEQRGLEIATEADRRDQGFKDSTAAMRMILRNKQGQESIRRLTVKTLEGIADGDKSLIIFHHPKDVEGTALLTYTHKKAADDQWLYLPALKRVKRIASNNKSGPFMGSEFAYEDFNSQEVEKYTYKYLRDTDCGKQQCFVIERYPLDKHSGYNKQIVWIDQNQYRVLKIEFYDKKNTLLKTLKMKRYKQYLNKYWRSHKMNMMNHQTQKSTELQWKDFNFKSGLSENEFTQSSLRRAR